MGSGFLFRKMKMFWNKIMVMAAWLCGCPSLNVCWDLAKSSLPFSSFCFPVKAPALDQGYLPQHWVQGPHLILSSLAPLGQPQTFRRKGWPYARCSSAISSWRGRKWQKKKGSVDLGRWNNVKKEQRNCSSSLYFHPHTMRKYLETRKGKTNCVREVKPMSYHGKRL